MDFMQDLLTSFVQMPAVWAAAWCGVCGFLALRVVYRPQEDHHTDPDQCEAGQVEAHDEASGTNCRDGRANG